MIAARIALAAKLLKVERRYRRSLFETRLLFMTTQKTAQDEKCASCRVAKPTLACGICKEGICKSCTQFLSEETFAFREKLPEDLRHQHYCSFCYSEKVQAEIQNYNQVMKKAKQVLVIDKPRRRPLPILKSSKELLRVKGSKDKEETLLRLAFLAAERGFNSIIKVNVAGKKIRDGGYQWMEWEATGYPADLEPGRLERQSN